MRLSRAVAIGCLTVSVSTAGVGKVAGVGATAPPTSEPVTSEPAGETTVPGDEAGADTTAADSVWTSVVPGADCVCADGAEFSFFVREADPTKVVFFLEGGAPASAQSRARSRTSRARCTTGTSAPTTTPV